MNENSGEKISVLMVHEHLDPRDDTSSIANYGILRQSKIGTRDKKKCYFNRIFFQKLNTSFETLVEEIKWTFSENYGYGNGYELKLKALFKLFEYQESSWWIKIECFPIKSSYMSVKNWIEVFWENIKTVVSERNEINNRYQSRL